MSENTLSLIITIGLFALTAAWVPCLDKLQRSVRRRREGRHTTQAHTEVEAFWIEPATAPLAEAAD